MGDFFLLGMRSGTQGEWAEAPGPLPSPNLAFEETGPEKIPEFGIEGVTCYSCPLSQESPSVPWELAES